MRTTWNKGLTKKTDARVRKNAAATARTVQAQWDNGSIKGNTRNVDYSLVRKLYLRGYSLTDIGKRVGLRRNALSGKIKERFPDLYRRNRKTSRQAKAISCGRKGKGLGNRNGMKDPATVLKCVAGNRRTRLERYGTWHPTEARKKESATKARLISEGKLSCARFPFKHGLYRGQRYDSSWELRRMKFFDEQGIRYLRSHGIRIRYKFEGRWHSYTPDFLVEGRILEEVKSSWTMDMRGARKKNEAKFWAARRWCKKRGLTFRLLAEEKQLEAVA